MSKNQWCEKHWEPFRHLKQQISVAAAMGLVQHVINDPEFKEKVAIDAAAKDQQKAMVELHPLCCRYTAFLDEFHKTLHMGNRVMQMDEIMLCVYKQFSPKPNVAPVP